MTGETPRMSISSNSTPEFEFWMVGNHPSFPTPHLLTADELFVDGVLLPLHLLHSPHHLDPQPQTQFDPDSLPSPGLTTSSSSPPPPFPSNRWKDIFKSVEIRKDKRKEKRGGGADLNIHIWPFTRSGSAGNGGGRTRGPTAGRKASSEPCSRSNSRGESTKPTTTSSTKRAASWIRLNAGIHLSRSRPVWQFRRSSKCSEPKANSTTSGKNGGVRVLNLKVNTCIGYGHQLGDEKDGVAAATDSSGGDGGGGNGSHFRLRAIFSKRVY